MADNYPAAPVPDNSIFQILADLPGEIQRKDTLYRQAALDQSMRYRLTVSQEEADAINKTINFSGTPEDEAYRTAAAVRIARELKDISIGDARRNLDLYELGIVGVKREKPKATFEAISDSFTLGHLNTERNQLGHKLQRAELMGDTEAAKEIRKQITATEKYQNTLVDTYKGRWFTTEAAKAFANSFEFSARTMGATLLGSAATPAVGLALGFAVGAYETDGNEYIDMRDSGMGVGMAAGMAAASSAAQSVIENLPIGSAFGLASRTAGKMGTKLIGGTAAKKLSMSIAGKIINSPEMKNFAAKGLEYLTGGIWEGVEEVLQGMASEATYHLADALNDTFFQGADEVETKNILDGAYDNFMGGFLASFVFGLPNMVIDIHEGTQKQTLTEAGQIIQAAESAKTPEEFKDSIKGIPLTKKFSDEQQAEIYQHQQDLAAEQEAGRQAAEAQGGHGAKWAALPTEEAPGDYRYEDKEKPAITAAVTHPEATDMSENGVVSILDPRTKTRQGEAVFRVGPDTVAVDRVEVAPFITNAAQVAKDTLKRISYEFPGFALEWNPESAEQQAVKQSLIAENPHGEDWNLTFYEKGDAFQLTREDVQAAEAIQKSYGISREKTQDFMAVNERLARSLKVDPKNILNNLMRFQSMEEARQNPEIGAVIDQGVKAAQGQYGGTFDPAGGILFLKDGKVISGQEAVKAYGQGVNALVLTTEKGDLSTLYHEYMHFVTAALIPNSPLYRNLLETAYNKKLDAFTDEDFDRLSYEFENYMKKGEAPTPGLKALFRRIAEALKDIVRGMRERYPLSPELKNVFDALFVGEVQAQKEQQAQAHTQAEQGRYQQAVEVSGAATGLSEEDKRIQKEYWDKTEAHRVMSSPLYSEAEKEVIFQMGSEALAEAQRQSEEVIRHYHNADGSARPGWLKAPNGKDSKLAAFDPTGRVWALARTPNFKKWFGDWEAAAELKITETNVAPDQAIEALKAFADKDLFNFETGITARINTKQRNKIVSNAALGKSLNNGFTAGQHNAVAANIDKIFKHASLVETAKDKGGDVNIVSIKRFASPVVFEHETAIAYLTLKESVEHGHRIYSLELIEIEKTPTKGSTPKEHTTARVSKGKVAQLYESVNSISKIIDENGEPKVFYHRSPNKFTEFDKNRNGTHNDAGWLGDGFYFYGIEEEGYGYGKNSYPVFLNMKEPYYATNEEHEELANADDREKSIAFTEDLKSEGYDGVYFNGDLREEAVTFSPNQIKSTDNTGTFGLGTGNIYFQTLGEQGAAVADKGTSPAVGWGTNNKEQENDRIQWGGKPGQDGQDHPSVQEVQGYRLGAGFDALQRPVADGSAGTGEDAGGGKGGGDSGTEGALGLEAANEKFNAELEQLVENKLPAGHIFKLGTPGPILRRSGFPAGQPIELSAKRLKEKSETERHPFSPSDIKGIVKAIQEPVAVFAYGDKNKAQNVIVELKKDDKNFLVGVHFNQERNGVFVSDIRGLYNKDNAEWLNWINQGKLLYADIEKLQSVVTQQQTNLAEVGYLDLEAIDRLLQKNKNVKHYFADTDAKILFQLSREDINGLALLYSSPEEWLRADLAMLDASTGSATGADATLDTLATDYLAAHSELAGESEEAVRERIKGWYAQVWNEAQAAFVERRQWEERETPTAAEQADAIPREKALEYVDEETLGRIQGKNTPPEAREGGYNASGTENDIETQPGEEEADFEDIEAVETDFDGEEEITVPVPQGDAQTEAGSESPAGGEKITTTEINRRFLKMLPGKVDSFIRMMGIVMVRSREDAQDEAEARQRDMDEEARETMQGEMNKHLKGIALGTRKGKEITSSQRKYALSVMSRNSTFYRELYSQIMLDKEFQEYARNEVRDNAAVEAARQAVGLTDYERAKIAEEVSDKELRKKILRQEASVEEVKEYLKHLDEDERKKDEQIAGYEKQAKEQIQKAAENLQDTKRMEAYIEKREREFKKTTDELESNIEQAYKEGKKTEKGIQRTRAEFKIAKLKAEIKRKQRERNAVLRYQAENNRLGRQIMSPAMVSGHIWVRQRELLLGIQNALFRSPDVRLYGVRSGNPTDSTDLADRGAIVVDGETMSLDEFVKRFWEGKIRYGFLDARLRKALRRTWESMADRRKYAAGKLAEKLTQSELQDILLVMRQLRNEGLANWSRREFVRNQDDRDMRRDIFNEQADIAAEGKTAEARKIIRAMKAADDQERERILKKGGRNWLMKLFFQTWDDKRLLQWMSGNTKGELYRLVIREYTKNTNQRNKATDKRIERVKGLLGKTEAEQMKKISEYGRRDITIEGIGPQYLDPAFRPGETEKKQIGASAAGKWIVYGPHLLPASRVIFSKAMLMYWYIAGENKFAMRHVIFGKLWSKDQQNLYEGNLDFREEEAIIKGKSDILNDAVKKHLTAEDKKVAEAIRDDFSAHWPEVKSQLEQMFNQLEEGQENYLPLQIIEGAHAQTEKESEVIALTQGAHQVKIQPDKGMGESRTDIGATHQQDIEMDIFKVFFRGVEQQEHFVKMAPYIRSLNNALRGMNNESKQIRERLTDTYGEWAMRRLDTHVNMMGLPPSARLAPASDSAGALARAFEGNTGAAMIAFNIPSWLAQYPQSIAPFFAKADPVFVLQALAEVMKPGSDLAERVWEKSPMVKNRVINTAQDYHESLQRQDSKWKRAQGKMIEIGMIGQRHADRTMVAAGWWALYETGRQKGMSDADATVWADEITAETQPNLKDIEVAPPFRDKGPGKLFFRFAQPLNVVWQNLTYDSFMSKEKSFGKIVGMFTAYGIAALIVAAMRGAIYDGDDEDEKGDVMRRVFYYLTVSSFAESVPLIADMASAGAERMITGDGKLYERQYFRLAKELFDIPGHVGDAEWEKALWDAVQAAGLATGAPVSQANRAKRAIENEDLWTLFGHNK